MSGARSYFTSKKKAAATSNGASSRNPFDSDSDDGGATQQRPPARASSAPIPAADQRGFLFAGGAEDRTGPSSGFASSSSAARSRYKNDFRDSGGVDGQSVQELEGYAAYKAEETTQRVDGCLRIAEEMRETASKTLFTVHQQGQQIRRTHAMAQDIDQDLSRVRTGSCFLPL
jgi:synaptosomal-associated protein 25